MEGVVVQPMIAGGVEVMVGVTQDPLFGPLIAFGSLIDSLVIPLRLIRRFALRAVPSR